MKSDIDKDVLTKFLYFKRVPYDGKFVASGIFSLLLFGFAACGYLWLFLGINTLWAISAMILTFAVLSIVLLERENRPKWCEFAVQGLSVMLLAIFFQILSYSTLVVLLGWYHVLLFVVLIAPIVVFVFFYIKYLKKKLAAGDTTFKIWPTPLKLTTGSFAAGYLGIMIGRGVHSSFLLFGIQFTLMYVVLLLLVPYISILPYKAHLCYKYSL